MKCRVCSTPIVPFLDFGKMPIANGFLRKEEFDSEYFYNLSVGFCNQCFMVQLMEQPNENMMFHENYAFYSSTSKVMASHFESFAKDVKDKHKPGFVVEIGSNDGIMLKHFNDIRHLGIEPSENVANVARDNGINTISCFFGEKVAEEVASEYGLADVILSANVFCHIPYLHSVISGVKKLLKDDGLFIFEDPYLGDILKKTSYDQIYDEHAYYFSLISLINLFSQHGMTIIDVEPQNVHGGSMRYTVAKSGIYEVQDSVIELVDREHILGFHMEETYEDFRKSIQNSRDNLIIQLYRLKNQGKRIVGYGATSKSTTITNYCEITPNIVDCIYDTTPIKQGKFSPGTHIPVKAYTPNWHEGVDCAILFAWNHAKEIMEKEKEFKGKWITYVDTNL